MAERDIRFRGKIVVEDDKATVWLRMGNNVDSYLVAQRMVDQPGRAGRYDLILREAQPDGVFRNEVVLEHAPCKNFTNALYQGRNELNKRLNQSYG